MTISLAKAKSDILSNFPQLSLDKITILGEGFDHIAFEVNQTYVFLFAKHSNSSGFGGSLEIQSKLLPKLKDHLNISIPDFEFAGQQQNGLLFVGYRKIQGEQLTVASYQKLSIGQQKLILKDLANFIIKIHSFSLEEARQIGVDEINFKAKYLQDKCDAEKFLFPFLNTNQQENLSYLVDQFIKSDDYFVYQPALLHADLWLEHMLIDQTSKRISGIIDFGDVIIGDPDYEFMQIYSELGPKTLSLLLQFISLEDRQKIIFQKGDFFEKWNIVRDFLTFHQRKDEEGLEVALAAIRKFTV